MLLPAERETESERKGEGKKHRERDEDREREREESQSWIFNLVCVRGVEDQVNRSVAVMELSVTSWSVQLDLLILKWALRDRNLPRVILCFATLRYTSFYGVSHNIKMETLFSILYQEQLKRTLILSLQRFCSP